MIAEGLSWRKESFEVLALNQTKLRNAELAQILSAALPGTARPLNPYCAKRNSFQGSTLSHFSLASVVLGFRG
jgi:hypothetical protein